MICGFGPAKGKRSNYPSRQRRHVCVEFDGSNIVFGETEGIQCEMSKHMKNYMGSYNLNIIAPIVTGSRRH